MEQYAPVLSPKGFGLSGGGKGDSFPLLPTREDATPLIGRGEYEPLLFAHQGGRMRKKTRDDAFVDAVMIGL